MCRFLIRNSNVLVIVCVLWLCTDSNLSGVGSILNFLRIYLVVSLNEASVYVFQLSMVIVGALYFRRKRLFGMYSFLKEMHLQEGEEQSKIISLLMKKQLTITSRNCAPNVKKGNKLSIFSFVLGPWLKASNDKNQSR